MDAIPVMNTESKNDWTLRPMLFAQWCVSVALLSATVSPTLSFSQGTLAQRLACTPDVLRLCSVFIPNVDEITICLRERTAELSDACRTAFERGMNQLPAASDDAGVRNRAAR
jgi:hypothetical protein